jgi:hypothetical protein
MDRKWNARDKGSCDSNMGMEKRHHYIVGRVYPAASCLNAKPGNTSMSDNIPFEKLMNMKLEGIPLTAGHPPVDKTIKDAPHLRAGTVTKSLLADNGDLWAVSELDTSTENGNVLFNDLKQGTRRGLSLGHVFKEEFGKNGTKITEQYIPDHLSVTTRPRRDDCFVYHFYSAPNMGGGSGSAGDRYGVDDHVRSSAYFDPSSINKSHITQFIDRIENLPGTKTTRVIAGAEDGMETEITEFHPKHCDLGKLEINSRNGKLFFLEEKEEEEDDEDTSHKDEKEEEKEDKEKSENPVTASPVSLENEEGSEIIEKKTQIIEEDVLTNAIVKESNSTDENTQKDHLTISPDIITDSQGKMTIRKDRKR